MEHINSSQLDRKPVPPSTPKPAELHLSTRSQRLFHETSRHQNDIDSEYASLHSLHREGRQGRRLTGRARQRHLPKVAKYLRESQPKSKYITDPAALTGPGQQDLQSAAYLINQLEQGRVTRMRRYQPKAKKRRRRKNRNKNKNKKISKTPQQAQPWLAGIHLGQVVGQNSSDTGIGIDDLKTANRGSAFRLQQDAHAQPGEQMSFIYKPASYCKEQAHQIESNIANSDLSMSNHMKFMMNQLLTMLEDHDQSENVTTGNSVWSSLPCMVENDIIQPTLERYRQESNKLHLRSIDEDNDDDDDDDHHHRRPRKKKTTTKQRLLELKLLRESTFEQKVEGVVHNILASFFAQYGGQNLGSAAPRSGRASVVKRYEELCKKTPHAIKQIASITAHHGINIEEQDKDKKKENEKTNYIEQNIHDAGVHHKKVTKSTKEHKINFIEQNKMAKSLVVHVDEVKQEVLTKNKQKRRASVILVKMRRQSIMIERVEDMEIKKQARLDRINKELVMALRERRCRIWGGMIKTVMFWTKTTAAYVEEREKRGAIIKLQSLFRKQLFKKSGPATIRTMILAKRALLPKLHRARLRCQHRASDQILQFLQDLKQLGGVRFAIRRFKKQNTMTQRLFRSHLVISRQRLECLIILWKQQERIRHAEKLEEARQTQNIKHGRNVASTKKREKKNNKRDATRSATRSAAGSTTTKKNDDGKKKKTTNSSIQTKQNREDEAAAAAAKKQLIDKHHGRKKAARKLVGSDPSTLKRIEKHVHAMKEAEEIVREAIATRIPRIPSHIRRQVLSNYLHERRKEHLRMSHEEEEYHSDKRYMNNSNSNSNNNNSKDSGGMFTQQDMLDLLRSDDIAHHPLIALLGKPKKKIFAGLHLFTGNTYKHTNVQRRADEDMRLLIERGITLANEWAAKQKQQQIDGGVEKKVNLRVSDKEVKEVMKRSTCSCVVGTSNDALLSDYLKAMLEENIGMFR